MQEVLLFVEICEPDLHNADSLHDQFDPVRWISHGLDQRDVILLQCVQGSNGSI